MILNHNDMIDINHHYIHYLLDITPPLLLSPLNYILHPIGSMYAIYGNIYHQYTPNVSIYTIHGSYGHIIKPSTVVSFHRTGWDSPLRLPTVRSTALDRGLVLLGLRTWRWGPFFQGETRGFSMVLTNPKLGIVWKMRIWVEWVTLSWKNRNWKPWVLEGQHGTTS